MENEQSQNFNERLSQWVANQGFWFQVRYSMSGSGMRGRALFHLLRMAFRLLIFAIVVLIGLWIYLVKRTDSAGFSDGFENAMKSAFSASEFEIRGLDRVQGQLEIARLAAEGGNETFFTAMEARNIRCQMGLLDGLVGVWKPGIVSISKLDIDLRAGADDAESARKLAEAVFRKSDAVELSTFEVADATVRWGYSERTQGLIERSTLTMQRTENGWRMSFRGGNFTQNWLKNLEIVNIVAIVEPAGLLFEKAELKTREGSVDFAGLRVAGGERPEVKGVVKIRKVNLQTVLPQALHSFVEGGFSGDFRVFGSTNTSDGVGFEGQVLMDGENVISLRERLHLLKALSVVDYSRNYHRIDFREGSFQIKTQRGGLEISDLKLRAEDLFTIEGAMRVRLPTPEEVQAAVESGKGTNVSPLFSGDEETAPERELPKTASDFTLKRAAQEARRIKEGTQSADSLGLFDRLGLSLEMRRLQLQASERMSRMLRYEGAVVITLPGDAFERAPRLLALYPKDPKTGRIAMRVPIEGQLWEVTLNQAEDVYQQGQR